MRAAVVAALAVLVGGCQTFQEEEMVAEPTARVGNVCIIKVEPLEPVRGALFSVIYPSEEENPYEEDFAFAIFSEERDLWIGEGKDYGLAKGKEGYVKVHDLHDTDDDGDRVLTVNKVKIPIEDIDVDKARFTGFAVVVEELVDKEKYQVNVVHGRYGVRFLVHVSDA